MKVLMLSVVCVCMLAKSQGLDLLKRFRDHGNIFGTLFATKPTNIPIIHSTPRTTVRNPSDMDLCEDKSRTWSDCVGNPPTRSTTDSCTKITQNCNDAIVLANLLAENLMGSSMEDSGSNVVGGTSSRGKSFNGCVVKNMYNTNRTIIAGKCQPIETSTSGNLERRKREKPSFIRKKRDLLIMMDESYSVGVDRFQQVKRIAAAIIKLLCDDIKVDPQHTRVAVTSFNGEVHLEVRLQSIQSMVFLDKNATLLADYILKNLNFHEGYSAKRTCLINALHHAYNTALDSKFGGRRGDPEVEQDIIIISDGCENCVRPRNRAKEQIREITDLFMNQEINVYVIGIGLTEECKSVLSLLAQGGKCYHFFYLNNWMFEVEDFILQLENPLKKGICLNSFETYSRQCLI